MQRYSRGNLISDSSYNYVYDDFGQLSVVMDGDSVIERYYYDHTGNRIKKVAGDETTYYVGDFVRVVNDSGTFNTLYYYLGGVLVAKNSSGVMSYYHPDHLGSTTLVTDISGAVVEDIDYIPYGGLIGASAQDRLYEGKELDDTGLEYFGARYYNPEIRIFIQGDSILPNIFDPQQLNRFGFERGNPYKYTDPTGNYISPLDILDYVSLADSAYQMYDNPSWENAGWLTVDVACAAVPLLGGVGAGGKTLKYGSKYWDEAVEISRKLFKDKKGMVSLGKNADKGVRTVRYGNDVIDIGENGRRYIRKGNDIDYDNNFEGALNDAFKNAKIDPNSKPYKTKALSDGTVVGIEWRGQGGSKVSIDYGHANNGPVKPHVGWQSAGKRNQGPQRGHNLLDDVPYGRD